jgi:hypothetical protein
MAVSKAPPQLMCRLVVKAMQLINSHLSVLPVIICFETAFLVGYYMRIFQTIIAIQV